MSGVTGRQAACAFSKVGLNSWGVAASVTKGIYFQSDGGLQNEPDIIEDDSFGQTFIGTSEVGNIKSPSPSFSANGRYEDFTYVLEALAMGSPSAVAISTSASGQVTSWLHQFDLAPSIDGLSATFAIDKFIYTEELTSAKIGGWTDEDVEGGLMRESFKVTGSKTTNTSSVNINSTIYGSTFPSLGGRVMKKHGIFRMNIQSAGSLVATDAVHAEKILFTFDRPQDPPFIYGQDFVDEPADNGFPVFSMEVTYPRMNTVSAHSLYAGLKASRSFKADWIFSSFDSTTGEGTMINSTDSYQKKYQFPNVQLEKFEAPLVGAQQVKPKAMFKCRLAQSSPSGMAFVNPFRLTRIMVNSVNAFA